MKWIEKEIKKLANKPNRIKLKDVIWAIRTSKLTGDTAGYGQIVPLVNPNYNNLRMLWHSPIGAVSSPFSPIFAHFSQFLLNSRHFCSTISIFTQFSAIFA